MKIENKRRSNSKKFANYKFKSEDKIIGSILASPNRKKILYSLSVPRTPKEISKETNLNFPTTSKTIKFLEDMNLVSVGNKDLRKGKIISISKKGETAVEDIKKREEEKK